MSRSTRDPSRQNHGGEGGEEGGQPIGHQPTPSAAGGDDPSRGRQEEHRMPGTGNSAWQHSLHGTTGVGLHQPLQHINTKSCGPPRIPCSLYASAGRRRKRGQPTLRRGSIATQLEKRCTAKRQENTPSGNPRQCPEWWAECWRPHSRSWSKPWGTTSSGAASCNDLVIWPQNQ